MSIDTQHPTAEEPHKIYAGPQYRWVPPLIAINSRLPKLFGGTSMVFIRQPCDAWEGMSQFAEDVTQQVFATLARKAQAVSRHPFLGAWLYTTTRHESANLVRRERRRKARERSASAMTHITSDESGVARTHADLDTLLVISPASA